MKRVDLANYIVIIGLILFFVLLIWSHYWNGPIVEGAKQRPSIRRPVKDSTVNDPSPSNPSITSGEDIQLPAKPSGEDMPASTTTTPASTTSRSTNASTTSLSITPTPTPTTSNALETALKKINDAVIINRTANQYKTDQDNRVVALLGELNTAKTNLNTAETTLANTPTMISWSFCIIPNYDGSCKTSGSMPYSNPEYTTASNAVALKKTMVQPAQFSYDNAISEQAKAVRNLETTASELDKAQKNYNFINATLPGKLLPVQKTKMDDIIKEVNGIAQKMVDIMGHVPVSISDISIGSISDIPYNENLEKNKANIDISMNLNVVPITNSDILSELFVNFNRKSYFPGLEIKTGQWNLNIKIPRGPKGIKGVQGDPGADGAQGAIGIEGDQGQRGEWGA